MRNTKQRDLLVDYNLNKALTINERIDIYKRNDIPLTSTNYVDKWLSNKSFVKNEEFLTRLETEKITMDEFNLALRELKDIEAEKIVFESLKDSHWYKLYEEVIEHYYENKDIFDKLNITYDIYSPIRVFLFWAESKINLHKGTLENINISNNAVHQMINGIASHCIKVFSKTLIYEFHKNKEEIVCSKANDLKLKIYMKERFTDIENIVAFFNTYPVLLRRLIIKIYNIYTYFIEMLDNIDENFDSIRSLLLGASNSYITHVDSSLGDTHQNGKFVIKLHFENNVLIYKPRNLQITQQYYEFINWVNIHADLEKLPTNKVFYGKEFTIENLVEYKTCTSNQEIKRFYKRYGQIIAFLYILRGNDIHYENLIANGEYPHIIDMETLFQIYGKNLKSQNNILDTISEKMLDSVEDSCLLPTFLFKDIDISALNGQTKELPFKVLSLTNVDNDNIRFEYMSSSIEGQANIPMLNGIRVDFGDYYEYIIMGFRNAMKFILENKERIILQLKKFKDIRIRHLMKSTVTYAYLLEFTSHPNYTTDMLKLEKLIENLWGHPYEDKRIIRYEYEDMLFGDIPIFFGQTGSSNVYSSNGELIEKLFKTSGLESAINRVNALDNKEIELQLCYIKSLLGKFDYFSEDRIKKYYETIKFDGYINSQTKLEVEQTECLDLVKQIADIILEARVEKYDQISWITYQSVDEHNKFLPMGPSMGNGLSGLMLFYYHLSRTINCSYYKSKFTCISNTLFVLADDFEIDKKLSAYEGYSSILYPLLAIYTDDPSEEYRDLIEKVIIVIDSLCDSNTKEDPVHLAPLLILLIKAYEMLNSYKYIITAEKIANKLIESIRYVGISNLKLDRFPSISSISLAFYMLYKHIEEEAFKLFGQSMLDNERIHLWGKKFQESPEKLELKLIDGDPSVLVHLGSHRIELLNITQDSLIEQELELIFSIVKQNTSKMHGYTNGIAGELDFLINYYEYNSTEEAMEAIWDKVNDVKHFYKLTNTFAVKGIEPCIEIDLLNGLSGLGYELLRIVNKNSIKSLTTLNIPNPNILD